MKGGEALGRKCNLLLLEVPTVIVRLAGGQTQTTCRRLFLQLFLRDPKSAPWTSSWIPTVYHNFLQREFRETKHV